MVNESISSLTFHSSFKSVIVSIVSPALITVLPFGTIVSSPRLIDTIRVFSGSLIELKGVFSILDPK